jgi:hypothetical protein
MFFMFLLQHEFDIASSICKASILALSTSRQRRFELFSRATVLVFDQLGVRLEKYNGLRLRMA